LTVTSSIVAPHFVTTEPTIIELKEGKRFHDARNGNPLFNIHFKRLTTSNRVVIEDDSGADIGHVRVGRTRSDTHYFGTSNKDKIGSVRSKIKDFRHFPDQCDAFIHLGDKLIGETAGNWLTKSFTISVGRQEVAKVFRNEKNVEGGFFIDLNAGVDAVFILMIVMCLGEMHNWIR